MARFDALPLRLQPCHHAHSAARATRGDRGYSLSVAEICKGGTTEKDTHQTATPGIDDQTDRDGERDSATPQSGGIGQSGVDGHILSDHSSADPTRRRSTAKTYSAQNLARHLSEGPVQPAGANRASIVAGAASTSHSTEAQRVGEDLHGAARYARHDGGGPQCPGALLHAAGAVSPDEAESQKRPLRNGNGAQAGSRAAISRSAIQADPIKQGAGTDRIRKDIHARRTPRSSRCTMHGAIST